MPTLRLRLLGDFQAVYGDSPLTTLDTPRLQSLLAYLLLTRQAPQSRRHVAFLLWPDSDEARARGNLRKFLHDLRLALPEAVRFLDVENTTLQWRADSPFTLDIAAFENGVSRSTSVEELEGAVALYRGDLLPSCYDDWILPERERLRELFASALIRLIDLLETSKDYAAAIRCARRLLQHDPVREDTYRRLMRLFDRNGDRAAALRTYQECLDTLQRELGAEPGPPTRAEYERLLKPVSLPSNLPKPLSSFIGRENERVEAQHHLAATRLLTLTGLGGIGKTRLSLEVGAAVLDSFEDGVWLVELAPLTDPTLVPGTIASVLAVREETGRSLLGTLTQFLRPLHIMLILDNCEHLLESCARLADTLLRACPWLHILATSREPFGITGETTFALLPLSLPDPRQALRGDHLESEAVRLFVERARSAQPGFALTDLNAVYVEEICLRLDGIPLAIELAAALVPGLTVEQIAGRLNDRFQLLKGGSRTALPRHQTLLAAIDWSYRLLDDKEQILLRRLSVFAGGWSLGAVEAICIGDGIKANEILDLVLQLVNKSLVAVAAQSGEARYHLLETIREYADRKLQEAGEAKAMRQAHAEYYLRLAKEAEPHFFGPELGRWLDRLEMELDNLRGALGRSKLNHDSNQGTDAATLALALEAAGYLWRFWELRGHISEGREWLDALLSRSANLPDSARFFALHTAGNLAEVQGDRVRAKQFYEECLAVSQNLGDSRLVAHMQNNLANIASDEGDLTRAQALYQDALTGYEQLGVRWNKALVLGNLGNIARQRGDYDRARALYEENLSLLKQERDKERIAMGLNSLGELAWYEGDLSTAATRSEEALKLSREVGDQLGVASSLQLLGQVALSTGDYPMARARLEESLALFREFGSKQGMARSQRTLGHLARQQGERQRALGLYKESLVLFQELGSKENTLASLEGLAGLFAEKGGEGSARRSKGRRSRTADLSFAENAGIAARLLGATGAQRRAIGTPLPASSRAEYDRHVALARKQLGEAAFQSAWAEGRAMTMGQAIAQVFEKED